MSFRNLAAQLGHLVQQHGVEAPVVRGLGIGQEPFQGRTSKAVLAVTALITTFGGLPVDVLAHHGVAALLGGLQDRLLLGSDAELGILIG